MRSSPDCTPAPEAPQTLVFEGWRLDLARRQLFTPDGTPRSLTSGEFNILSIFCQNSRKVLSRDDLLDLLHGRAAAVFDRSIDVQISRLRRKIETNLEGSVVHQDGPAWWLFLHSVGDGSEGALRSAGVSGAAPQATNSSFF